VRPDTKKKETKTAKKRKGKPNKENHNRTRGPSWISKLSNPVKCLIKKGCTQKNKGVRKGKESKHKYLRPLSRRSHSSIGVVLGGG